MDAQQHTAAPTLDEQAWHIAVNNHQRLMQDVWHLTGMPLEIARAVAIGVVAAGFMVEGLARGHGKAHPECTHPGHPFACAKAALLHENAGASIGYRHFIDPTYNSVVHAVYFKVLRLVLGDWETKRAAYGFGDGAIPGQDMPGIDSASKVAE